MRRCERIESGMGAYARACRAHARDSAWRMDSTVMPHADREGRGMRAGGRLRCGRARACLASSTVAPS